MFGPKSKKGEPTMPAAAVAPTSFQPAPVADANDNQSSKGGKATMQNVIGKIGRASCRERVYVLV